MSNRKTLPFTIKWSTINIFKTNWPEKSWRHGGLLCESSWKVGGKVICTWSLVCPPLSLSCCLHLNKKLKSGSHCLSSPKRIVGTTIIMLARNWKPCDVLTSHLWRCSILELVTSHYIHRGKRQSDEPTNQAIVVFSWFYLTRMSEGLEVQGKQSIVCIKLSYVMDNLIPRCLRSCAGLRNDLTMATSMKTFLKNRLRIFSLFLAIIPSRPVT